GCDHSTKTDEQALFHNSLPSAPDRCRVKWGECFRECKGKRGHSRQPVAPLTPLTQGAQMEDEFRCLWGENRLPKEQGYCSFSLPCPRKVHIGGKRSRGCSGGRRPDRDSSLATSRCEGVSFAGGTIP